MTSVQITSPDDADDERGSAGGDAEDKDRPAEPRRKQPTADDRQPGPDAEHDRADEQRQEQLVVEHVERLRGVGRERVRPIRERIVDPGEQEEAKGEQKRADQPKQREGARGGGSGGDSRRAPR